MQTEATKLIFVLDFSVLRYFKFAPRTPQIAQIIVSTFKIFWRVEGGGGEGLGGRGGGRGACPRTHLEISSFFFSLAIAGSEYCFLSDPKQDGKSGRTVLFYAAETNQKAAVELLIGRGADPEIANYAGVVPAMAAQGRSHTMVARLLARALEDPSGEEEKGGEKEEQRRMIDKQGAVPFEVRDIGIVWGRALDVCCFVCVCVCFVG